MYVIFLEVEKMSVINNTQIDYLKKLSSRLNTNGFLWQHEDHLSLTDIIPEMLCHLCIHGDKNDGICMECFNEKYFKYYLDER